MKSEVLPGHNRKFTAKEGCFLVLMTEEGATGGILHKFNKTATNILYDYETNLFMVRDSDDNILMVIQNSNVAYFKEVAKG